MNCIPWANDHVDKRNPVGFTAHPKPMAFPLWYNKSCENIPTTSFKLAHNATKELGMATKGKS